MEKKKTILVIIISAILALAVSLLLKQKNVQQLPDIKTPIVQEESKEIVEENVNDPIEPATQIKQDEYVQVQKIEKSLDKIEESTPVFEKLQVEETQKIEEAGVTYVDPGIVNDNGIIVITRDFKVKSPDSYSFRGFGVLEKSINK